MNDAFQNWSTTTANTVGTVAPFPVWLMIWFELFEPWILIFGILGNILVVCVIPRAGVTVGPSLKIYYTSIGVSDIINLVQYCFYTLFNDTMFLLTNGLWYWPIGTQSDLSCNVMMSVWELCEGYSNYAVVAMMLERCIVVFFPLQAKRYITKRFTVALLCLCVLPVWLTLLPASVLVTSVQYNTAWSIASTFCGWNEYRPAFPYFSWVFQLNMFTLHAVLTVLLSLVLSALIAANSRRRFRKLMHMESDHFTVSAKENSAIMIMLVLAFINMVIFIPATILYCIIYVANNKLSSQASQDLLANLGRFSQETQIIAHSLNFLVYFSRIPTFRAELILLFGDCLKR